jgi:hypothetical protein
MSGGRWYYGHERLREAADEIESLIAQNPYEDSPEILLEYQHAVVAMRRAAIYWQRIDWLASGDDGEETFHRRLREELAALETR